MPIPLDWNLEPGDDPVVASDRPRFGWRRLFLAVLYLVTLAAAAWFGFGLGAVTQGRRAGADVIANQLAVESLAWREADAGLYQSTLDPDAPSEWRSALVEEFSATAPRSVTMSPSRVEMVDAATAVVYVEVADGRGTRLDRRTYRLTGRAWYRTGP